MRSHRLAFGFFLVCFCQGLAWAQPEGAGVRVLFFDNKWQPTNEENASYFRQVSHQDDSTWYFQDFFRSGQKQMEGPYRKGAIPQRQGRFTWYHLNGNKASQARFERDRQVDSLITWYDSGQLEQRGYYQNGKPQGLWRTWHRNGALQQEGHYVDSLRSGIWRWYHPNGQLRSEGAYDKGYRSGLWRQYHANGALEYALTYVRGEIEGRVESFYPNGQKRNEGLMHNTLREGFWRGYWEDGSLESETRHQGGEVDSIARYYHPFGYLSAEEIFENGQMQRFTFFDPEGNPLQGQLEYSSFPEYVGPGGGFSQVLSRLPYPKPAFQNRIEGKVRLSITIDGEGYLKEVEVLESPGFGLDTLLENTIRRMKRWKPARFHNRPQEVSFEQEVNFRLESQKELMDRLAQDCEGFHKGTFFSADGSVRVQRKARREELTVLASGLELKQKLRWKTPCLCETEITKVSQDQARFVKGTRRRMLIVETGPDYYDFLLFENEQTLGRFRYIRQPE